jgi:hypothetical protein
MKKIHITLLVLGSFFCDGSNAQTNSFNKTVLYDCVFNLKFDRTKEYKRFDASLIINNSNSIFFMLPRKDEVNSDGKTLDLLIEVDTLFRVIKNIEEEYTLFSSSI